jgi:hypothetical protein
METTKFSPDHEKFLQIFQLSCSPENKINVPVYRKIIRVQCGIIFYHVCFTCAKCFAFCRSRIFVSWDIVANLKADLQSSHEAPCSSLRVHAWALSSNYNAKQLILINASTRSGLRGASCEDWKPALRYILSDYHRRPNLRMNVQVLRVFNGFYKQIYSQPKLF